MQERKLAEQLSQTEAMLRGAGVFVGEGGEPPTVPEVVRRLLAERRALRAAVKQATDEAAELAALTQPWGPDDRD